MNTTIVEVEKLNDSWLITIFDSKENDYNKIIEILAMMMLSYKYTGETQELPR